jgi:alkaline phosphatase
MLRIRSVVAALLAAIATSSAAATPTRPTQTQRPTNVILMIADGCGPATVTLGRMVAGRPLALDGILVGSVATGSASSRVTDSAASGTAMASGVKTKNGMIGVDTTGRAVPTVMERAHQRGMATGLVVKSTMTDATPAVFAAHVQRRASQDSIAVQEIEHRVDVLLGGGRDWFLPISRGGARKDSTDVIATAKRDGYAFVATRAELAAARRAPLLGLFAHDDMSYAIDRDTTGSEPGLLEMARKALALLSGRKPGFFLMVEGSLVDHAGHANDPATHVRELLEYDEAVRAMLDFARRDGHTLVVSTADHETGGLSLGLRINDKSYYEVDAEGLRGVKASASRMADSIATSDRSVRRVGDILTRFGFEPTLDEVVKDLQPNALGPNDAVAHAIAEIESRRARVGWSSGGHTAVDVGLYAFGPGSERFRGFHDNTEVAHLLAEAMGVSLATRPIQAGSAAR